MGLKMADFGPEKANFRPEKGDIRSERFNLGLKGLISSMKEPDSD